MRRAILPFVLGLLGFGLCVTSVAMAASGQPVAAPFSSEAPLYGYDAVSPTITMSHPVASAIFNHFSDDLAVTYDDIIGLHEDGYGFGEIAKIYFIISSASDPEDALAEILALREQGLGWGEILKLRELPPGLAGYGGNLGSIMSNRDNKKGPDWMPWGQKKKQNNEGAGLGPPSLKASDEDDDDNRGGGPPFTPPGQLKKENKGKGKK